MKKRIFIIAEAGVNHNGNLNSAIKMVDAACETGVDAIKFQTFSARNMVSKFAKKANYQKGLKDVTQSQLSMLTKLELDKKSHIKLMEHCAAMGILFLSTPFDVASVDLLNSLGLEIFKISSGDITNFPLLKKIGSFKKKIILSTGMCGLREIEDALLILLDADLSISDITLLHCNTEYPTPFEDVNLRAMLTMKNAFPGVKTGFSDHTLGIEVSIAAAALGAKVIEKHFTLDRTFEGPDHSSSIEPNGLKEMVQEIRNVERSLGTGIKRPSKSELKNIIAARKSIVAKKDIKKGELFTEENIDIKRPGSGISPMEWPKVIGIKAIKDFQHDELIIL